jgi:hypothetical protein
MNTTWMKYLHTVEIWEKVISTNAAGQRIPNYTYLKTIPCTYEPISARERQSPTYENRNRDQLFIPPVDQDGHDIVITYDTRFKNICDRFGHVIRGDAVSANVTSDSEMYDVHMLLKRVGFSGKLRFYHVMIMTAVET